MNAFRLSVLIASAAIVAAPIVASAAPSDATSACSAPSRSLVERRIEENAARGLPALIAFVNRTQPIYQLTLEDAAAWVDTDRDRRTACLRAGAEKVAD
jgi:hypothetical protein